MTEEKKIKMAKECMSLIVKKTTGEIDSKQFNDELSLLHDRYPMVGHNPPLSQFQLKHYSEIQENHKDTETEIMYVDHLQPWNWAEAAQMYYWHSKERVERVDMKKRASGEND